METDKRDIVPGGASSPEVSAVTTVSSSAPVKTESESSASLTTQQNGTAMDQGTKNVKREPDSDRKASPMASNSKKTKRNKSPTTTSPFHELMEHKEDDAAVQKQRLRMLAKNRRLARDYVARRYQAFAKAKHMSSNNSDNGTSDNNGNKQDKIFTYYPPLPDLWAGVSNLERAIISCCEGEPREGDETLRGELEMMESKDGNDEDLFKTEPEARKNDGVHKFLHLLAIHCHDLPSRSLALAVLERSLEEDQLDAIDQQEQQLEQEKVKSVMAMLDSSSNGTPEENGTDNAEGLVDPPPLKRMRLREPQTKAPSPSVRAQDGTLNDKSSDGVAEGSEELAVYDGRVHTFLMAGGLRILQRWLTEASTPVPAPDPPKLSNPSRRPQRPSASSTDSTTPSDTVPSPTGQLLLPLLQFLKNIPFDFQLVKKTKVNKQISRFSKEIDSLIKSFKEQGMDDKKLELLDHPKAGGSPLLQIKKAMDELKDTWAEKAKTAPKQASRKESYKGVKNLILDRLEVLKAFEESEESGPPPMEKPSWLVRVEDIQKAKSHKRQRSQTKTKTPGHNTADMARREREREREAMMKEDLQKAREQKRILEKRLRELKQQQGQNGSGEETPSSRNQSNTNQRRIRWKDGLGPSARDRIRQRLEQVFILPSTEEQIAVEQEAEQPADSDVDDEIDLFGDI